MKKSFKKIIMTAIGMMVISATLAACSGTNDTTDTSSNGADNANTSAGVSSDTTTSTLKGSITATGSSALQPLADEVAQMFQEANPDATVSVQGGGSGTGLKDVAAGNSDIGNSDVFAEEKLPTEQCTDLVDHKVAIVAFAAVVNEANKVDDLTSAQLIDIFTGKITNWKEVGGDDIDIVLISRPDSSGTKATFKKYALKGASEASGEALKEDSSGAVSNAVKQTEGAIAYLASSYLNNDANRAGIKVLKFEGIEMSKENVTNGTYPIWSYEHMYTKGVATGVAAAYLEFFNTDAVKAKIDALGYIPTGDMKVTRDEAAATAPAKVSGTITATGSSALQPLADQVAQMFQEVNPDATVNVQGGGSGTGLKDVAAGNSDIGDSDVFAEEKLPADQCTDLVDHKVCVVAFAAVVNEANKVDDLTSAQLIDIFTGKITNWKEVGGDDIDIVLISRPDSSGTKATFKKYALNGASEASGEALKEDSSGAVSNAVKQTEGAIAYLASSYLNNEANRAGIKVLKFEGVEMNKENVTNGTYPIWSYEHMYTKGEATGVAKAYLDFFSTDDVKAIIDTMGYIPNSDMKVSR